MVGHLLITAIPLAAALTVALAAAWRRWAPPLAVAMAAGIALRLYIAVIAGLDPSQPVDFMYQFANAIQAVLHHQDPLQLPNSQWHFLPAMAYVNVAEYQLGILVHLPWQFVGRAAPVIADIALIPLVGALAGAGRRRRAAALQYALNPVVIMVSAIHGQLEPAGLAFGVGALLVALRVRKVATSQGAARSRDLARSRWRAQVNGVLLGIAISANSWPALLIPGLLRALPDRRRRLEAMAWTAGIPLLFLVTGPAIIGYPARYLGRDIRSLLITRGVIGDWGWTVLVIGGNQEISAAWGLAGTLILLAVLTAVMYLWRRAHPVDLITAMALAFLAATNRLGSQYLAWPVPWQAARPSRGTGIFFALASAWAGAGYLWIGRAPDVNAWLAMHQPWSYSSLAVLPFLVLAMPWARRAPSRAAVRPVTAPPGDGQAAAQDDRQPVS